MIKVLDVIERFLPFIGIVLLIFLISSIGLDKILSAISKMDIFWFLVSASLLLIRMPLNAYKWYLLARDQSVCLRYRRMLELYLIGYFYALVTPGGIGNYIRVKFLYDEGKGFAKSFSNVAIDNLIEMANLHGFAIIGICILFPGRIDLLILAIALLLLAILPLAILLGKGFERRIAEKLILLVTPRKYRNDVERNLTKLFENPPSLRIVGVAFAISALTWAACFFQIYPVFVGMHVGIGVFDLISVWAISMSISLLPITIGGVGVREWLVMTLSRCYGIERSISLSISLVGFVVILLIPSLIGLALLHSLPNHRNDGRR